MPRVLVRKPLYPNDFRALFQALSRLAVATSCGLSAGCSVEGTPLDAQGEDSNHPRSADPADGVLTGDAAQKDGSATPPDPGTPRAATATLPGAWVPLTCSEKPEWPLENTKPVVSLDSFALYATYLTPAQRMLLADGGTVEPPSFNALILYGSPCQRASDQAACMRAIEEQAATKCTSVPCTRFALATRGDTVIRVQDRSDISALFGEIDTETEAAVVALLADGSVECWRESIVASAESTGTRIRAVEGGYEVETLGSCYGSKSTGSATVAPDGSAKVLSNVAYCLGRRPDGLLPLVPCAGRSELGAHFASATQLEAASVFAFEQLARDLTRLGAPPELVQLALRSAFEEAGHVRLMGALAQRFGGELRAARITPGPARDMLAIALENAVEGCVRETYGAVLACYQAEAARDPEVRAAMRQLFEDETRHAQLAWQIAAWIEPRLSEMERDTLQRARREAYTQLRSELDSSLSCEARLQIGIPDVGVGTALLAQLDAALGLQAA